MLVAEQGPASQWWNARKVAFGDPPPWLELCSSPRPLTQSPHLSSEASNGTKDIIMKKYM